ncbi:FxLYD domain-containing protein [Bordetella genomosp. 11]|uniref:DUF3426 domain-containing protein n=1 Tax=Bordetella genomosp. 11 TaxID=1416808 RepID=A0A261UX75_9BORD|nr:FxLYD domain-containing protein [Bordetella genomosp. 11]OZI66484.1 hypothetical protein CAL28_01730 [Bordetella genomosp. 11]
MKRLLAIAILAAAALNAAAQSLPQGVTIDNLAAVKDTGKGTTYIRATVHNDTGKTLNRVSVLFQLQDSQGNVIGTTSAQTFNLPDKQSWNVNATTTLPFARFTAYEVKAE